MLDLPPWRLCAGNGALPDLTSLDPAAPFQPIGNAQTPDITKRVPFDGRPANALTIPQVQIYEHIDFGGHNEVTSLNWYYVGDWWNDRISSLVIYSGRWRFYLHWHYEGPHWDLGPGQYRWVEAANIPNDCISSFKFIGW
ncbi:MAG TPA: beta/gamma crystallin-related protein [Caulifigura sp.]|nr:beta/gamma crystallin-related protein [Caulifigura sp.]